MGLQIIVSLFAVLGFGLILWLTDVVGQARKATRTTLSAISGMMDSELDDDAKEIAARRAGIGLIISAIQVFWRFALALAVAAVPIYAADAVGLAPRDDVLSLMLRFDYIIIVSVIAIGVVEGGRRLSGVDSAGKQAAPGNATLNHYSPADRFFHGLAFSSPAVLKGASWFEDRLLGQSEPETRPIFITSLARGGTTALLNALHDVPSVATHTYRDMPFVTAPILWNRMSGGEKRAVTRHQRAHGDGLEIDLDSPEAFEEVLWKLGWPEKYKADRILLWDSGDRQPAAERFMALHMGKIKRARQGQFSINDRDSNTPHIKKVRVVATLEYYLTD